MLKGSHNFFTDLKKNKNIYNHLVNDYNSKYESVKKLSFDYFKNFYQFYHLDFAEFGDFHFPFIKMGNVDTRHLFNLDEMMNFSFYLSMKNKYKNVADFGSNIGLHSVLLSKCFHHVDSYEPLKFHFDILKKVKSKNQLENLTLINKAVVTNDQSTVDFVHVKDNSTGSHVKEFKDSYGDREFITVDAINVKDVISQYDFVKMDVEGYENSILSSFDNDIFRKTDFLIEVGTPAAASELLEISKIKDFSMYTQKISWKKANSVSDLPTSCREGNVIISSNKNFIW